MSYAEYEDGRVNTKQHIPHGSQLTSPDYETRLDPLERIAWRGLLDTIIDCYMIGKGRWQHFKCSEWHSNTDAVRIYETASARVVDWVNGDRFHFQLKHFKFMGGVHQARVVLCEALNGRLPSGIETLIESRLGPNPTGKGGFTTTKENESNG